MMSQEESSIDSDGSPQPPFVSSILFATDFAAESDPAFAHALVVALFRGTKLAILHAGDQVVEDWERFPPIRRTLSNWGLLEAGSPRSDVYGKFGVEIVRVSAKGTPVREALRFVDEHEPDLLVLGTEGREGLARLAHPSVAERVARRTGTMTLFVPKAGRGFVAIEDGTTSLQRILVPVDHTPSPDQAIVLATRAAEALGDPPCTITLLHVGKPPMPSTSRPEGAGWRFEDQVVEGNVVDAIVKASEKADLVVMPTDGRDGPLDLLRGSHSERVVRRVTCPVLAVPTPLEEQTS